ncbi:hypothetical protein MTR_8g028495 [Medicago truncatula]|uniref:Uncharacterized protein n=1 Tax=Medicago truncatula TaxID=3880 RepID=A0A072TMZ8_MEDTR|nr:hypothetical protein MTR_8g028495 [Medicago truncatula]
MHLVDIGAAHCRALCTGDHSPPSSALGVTCPPASAWFVTEPHRNERVPEALQYEESPENGGTPSLALITKNDSAVLKVKYLKKEVVKLAVLVEVATLKALTEHSIYRIQQLHAVCKLQLS